MFALPSVTGLVRWSDYIPVKLVASADAALEGRTDAGGFIPMDMLSSNAGLMGWVDYLPVYVDNSATDAWAITAAGFIPYAASGGGASIPDFYLNLSSPTNVTLGTTQARGSLLVSGAVISQSAVPSRTSGVAPLYVNIDATGTTSTLSTNAAHELYFATDFGDPSAGTWANGVQSAGLTSKNLGIGPVTGYVYETPGTYTVTTVITDGVNTEECTNTITVQDPNTVYAGALTICISHSGNFTGAPSGATQVNTAGNTDMYAAWNTHKASNKRILFCKADAWTASATIRAAGLSNMIIGGYGTGVAHTFSSGTMVSVTPATGISNLFSSSGATDVKFCNFRIAADATHVACASLAADDIAVTWYKIEVRGANCAFSLSPNVVQDSLWAHDQTCLYECLNDDVYGYAAQPAPSVTGATASNGSPCIFTSNGHPFKRFNKVRLVGTPPTGFSTGVSYYISASNLTANTFSLSSTFSTDTPMASSSTGTCDVVAQALGGGQGLYVATSRGGIMGGYFDNCNHGEQTIRVPYISKGHINNNYIARPNQTKNVLKIHARPYDEVSGISSGYSEKFVVSANELDLRGGYSYNGTTVNDVGAVAMTIGNGGPGPGGQRVRNVIVESNISHACLGDPKDNTVFIEANCPNMTIRNNIADFAMGDRSSAFTAAYAYVSMHFASVNTSTPEQTSGVRIYNNTLYSNIYNASTATFVFIGYAGGTNPEVNLVTSQNNLWYFPHHNVAAPASTRVGLEIGASAVPTNVTSTYNTDTVVGGLARTSPLFVATPPVALTDWRTTTGSYAISSGTTVPVLRDFNNVIRYGAGSNLGAVLP